MTEEETRQLHKVIIEIAQGQDRRGDQLVEAIARLEELKRAFAFLLEQVSFRLTEKNINDMMSEAMDREKRLRKFERGHARPRPS